MFCSKCGNRLNENNICMNCGNNANILNNSNCVNVVFIRKKSIYGCAVAIKIFVDGILIGKVKNNSSLSIMLPIGIHNVKFDVWSGCTDYNITISQGCRTVYLEFGIKMGLLTNELEILSCRYE